MSAVRIASDAYTKDHLSQGEATQPRIDAGVEHRRRPKNFNTAESADGIYNIRSRTAGPQLHKEAISRFQDDDPGLRRETDFKQKQVI